MAIGPDGLVRRRCTGRLRVPGRAEPNFKELIQSLREQFGERAIVGVQPFGLGRFEVLFGTEDNLNTAVEKGLLFGGSKHDIEPAESTYKWLYAKYAPFELDLKDFKTYLAPYGEVMEMGFVYPEEMSPWHNGERKLKFRMIKAVPNYVKMGNYTVHFHYAGVVKLCRKCHSSDHMAKDCQNNNCRRCGKPGHMEADCRGVRGCSESPETMVKIIEKTRDELLKDLRAINPLRAFTGGNERSNDQEQEQERGEETGSRDDTSERQDDSEGMPELESEEEQDVETEEEPEVEAEEAPEGTREQQDLERKKYLKEKESEGESRACQKGGLRKKKMTKQERKKRRLAEERERNSKREREESKSPPRVEPSRKTDSTEEIEQARGGSEKEQEGEKDEKNHEEKKSTAERRKKENIKVTETMTDTEKPGVTKTWMFFRERRTYGEITELISNNLGTGKVEKIEQGEESGVWGLRFVERRWAEQVYETGLKDKKETLYPEWWSDETIGEKRFLHKINRTTEQETNE